MIVVTRHPALTDYAREIGLVGDDVRVIAHVDDPTVLDGQVVVGVLPMHLAARCAAVCEIPLALTAEDRGKDLPIERLREIAGEPCWYEIRRVEPLPNPRTGAVEMIRHDG